MERLSLFLEQLLLLGGVEWKKNPSEISNSFLYAKEGGTGRLQSNKFQVLFSEYYVGYEAALFWQN